MLDNNIVLVFKDTEAYQHWMVKRIFKRAGLDLSAFPVLFADSQVLTHLNDSKYKVALVFGEDALQTVVQRQDILRFFNRTIEVELKDRKILVCPCLEPKKLLARKNEEEEGRKKRGMRHPPRYQGATVECIRRAIALAESPAPFKRLPTTYLEDPSVEEFGKWIDKFYSACTPETILSWDIETPYKLKEQDEDELEEDKRRQETVPIRISFAYEIGKAVSVPWLPEYFNGIRRLLLYTGFHTGWNCLAFDRPIVEGRGFYIGGTLLDGMDLWHLYQTDLDKGLEHVTGYYTDLLPWKHLSNAQPALYSCIDADAALRNIMGILADLRRVGLLERGYKEMEIINILNEAGKRGNLINNPLRLELKEKWERELFGLLKEAQRLVDKRFLKIKYYKRVPKTANPDEWAREDFPTALTVCDKCGKKATVKHKCTVDQEGWQKTKQVFTVPHYYQVNKLEKVNSLVGLNDYLKTSGFNPCSSQQMLKYMKAHKHPVGTNHKTDKDTADVKHLKKLVGKYGKAHPIYAKTLTIKLLQKAISTYINGLEPDAEGLMHTTYVNGPSTWRLSSRNVNVQNLGKSAANPYAKEARKIIIPSDDSLFVQVDSSAIEAVMVGWFMQDDHYISEARKGIHAGLTCKKLNILPTPEHRVMVKEKYPDLYRQIKVTVHGSSYGMGPYLMYMTYPDIFPTLKSAKEMQSLLFTEMPNLPKWHHQLRVFAQKNGYLDNPWKVRHYFYDVFHYKHDEDGQLELDENGQPKIVLGKDGKRVIAFKPQSSAGMFMRDNVELIANTEARAWMPAIFSIHDGYTLHVPYARKDTAINILGEILTRPIAEMGNLRIGAEVEVSEIGKDGGNFLQLKTVSLIEVN